jgi:hypothetical protein
VRGTRKTPSDDTPWVTSDQELLDLLQEGGLPAEHAGLELLLRRKPQRWEDAAGLLGLIDGSSPTAVDALAELVADVSSHRGHRARHRTMTNRRRVVARRAGERGVQRIAEAAPARDPTYRRTSRAGGARTDPGDRERRGLHTDHRLGPRATSERHHRRALSPGGAGAPTACLIVSPRTPHSAGYSPSLLIR